MADSIRSVLQAVGARRVARRRRRNLGAAARPAARGDVLASAVRRLAGRWRSPGAAAIIAVAGMLAAAAGAVVIVRHAQALAAAAPAAIGAAAADPRAAPRPLPQLQAIAPGVSLTVPADGAIAIVRQGAASVLVVGAGSVAAPPVRVDLCRQMRVHGDAAGALVPLRIGYDFAALARWVGDGAAPGLRAVALAGGAKANDADMPKMEISGHALGAGAPLRLRWQDAPAATAWVGAAGKADQPRGARGDVALGADGWLVWRADAAIHFQRQRSAGCAAGQLTLQVVRAGSGTGRGLVSAYGADGAVVARALAAGRYQVPALVAASLEDQFLFEQLRARGMARLDGAGLAELAPRDLPQWRAAPAARASALASWDPVVLDDGAVKLLKRLYRMADGAYVREQVRIFNGERRLLAWRLPLAAGADASADGQWQVSVDGARAGLTAAVPASATRLFAAVGQGWQDWRRVGNWPAPPADAAGEGRVRLHLTLAQPAPAGRSVRLMLIGRAGAIDGATVRRRQGVCDGRACPAPDAAELLVLDLLPGARSVSLTVTPLDMAALALPGDRQYRHLRVADGQLAWLPLPPAPATAAAPAALAEAPTAAPLLLEDRNGAPLWRGGAPTAAAADAGLATLLGVHAQHAASIAGMLGRLPTTTANATTGHSARLTIDLALQAASARAVECVGMRAGRLHGEGAACTGGQTPPAGRHAGMVIVDAETGEILAAAGAGGAAVNAANWPEVRNFDRSDPARSPLRLPALQHDGGAHASPGSTFKVITALGLEQAATADARIDALLGGLPLASINEQARRRGFAFQTGAAIYPNTPGAAHVTNYKGLDLDRRAADGRLGLAQALTYSLNSWFAWTAELSDRSLFGRADGGVPDVQALEPGALDAVRPIVGMARRLGFGSPMRLDGGLLPADFQWGRWDALQASAAQIDPVHSRHELRQMAIGLRMQVTPLQMALAAAAVGQGSIVAPRLLQSLDGRAATPAVAMPVGVRLERIRAGMKGVVDVGTAAGAFGDARLARVRRGLSGKTGTAPTGSGEQATVWFTGWLEPGSLPGQRHRLALAAFVSHSAGSGGEHAAPLVAAVLASMAANAEQRGK